MRHALAVCLLGACSDLDPASATHVCTFYFRPSVEVSLQDERSVEHRTNGDGASFEMGDFHVATRYFDDVEGHGLHVSVTTTDDAPRGITTHLFQFGDGIRDQFVGEHGYSGLVYTYHPTTDAELQFICRAE